MTKIEWTQQTWNPIAGCSVVSPGCTNCYAMKMAARLERMGNAPHYAGTTQASRGGPVWTGKIGLAPDSILTAPLRRRNPRRRSTGTKQPHAWIARMRLQTAPPSQEATMTDLTVAGFARRVNAELDALGYPETHLLRDTAKKIVADAALAAMPGPRVKPLVWYGKPNDQKMRIGRCGEIAYSVEFAFGRWGYRRSGTSGLVVSRAGGVFFRDEADAIDGADEDHERRILAALEGGAS